MPKQEDLKSILAAEGLVQAQPQLVRQLNAASQKIMEGKRILEGVNLDRRNSKRVDSAIAFCVEAQDQINFLIDR